MNLQISALTRDAAFLSTAPGAAKESVIKRAWGDASNQKLGAPGLQVSVLQKFLGSFIPETSMGRTGGNGQVSIKAVDGGSIRGATGLCIELANDAARVIGDSIFFLPVEICDFRAFNANDPTGSQVPGDFKLQITSNPQAVHIDNTMLSGIYQGDDVYRYGQRVIGMSVKRANILTGYWADTIAPSRHDDTLGNHKGLFAACLNFPNIVSDVALGVAVTGGAIAGSVAGPLGTVVGSLGAGLVALKSAMLTSSWR